ncbi:MAG: hypothetical protein EHM47_05440 [Ignavibacteriales bacterium]|nr:MAG: hypothetical protein EHM47_05440 [Ignavibacteriales bacterium]
MKSELDILKDVVLKLNELNIDYMITGSVAMMFYAQPRMTRDIDIVIEFNKLQAAKFIQLFKNDYYLSEEAIEDSINTSFIFNLIHLKSSVKIDFILRKKEEYRIVEFQRRRKVNFFEYELYLVSKEDLILSKLFWGKDSDSELQKRDIKGLLLSGYDKEYLIKWAKKLNLYEYFLGIINE